jgi:hypothetical protein
MLYNCKVYNVDVFDIKWEGIDNYPIKLPTQIESLEISIPVDHNEDYMLNYIFNSIIEMYDIDDNYVLSIAQAKIKVNSMYYFSKYYDTTRG